MKGFGLPSNMLKLAGTILEGVKLPLLQERILGCLSTLAKPDVMEFLCLGLASGIIRLLNESISRSFTRIKSSASAVSCIPCHHFE